MRASGPENVAGDWYVAKDCCLICAVPHAAAPTLFAWAFEPGAEVPDHCYVSKQPADDAELEAIVNAAECSELDCIRYRGTDPRIRERLLQGERK